MIHRTAIESHTVGSGTEPSPADLINRDANLESPESVLAVL